MFSRISSAFVGSACRTKGLVTAGSLALSFAGIGVGYCSAREDGSSDGSSDGYKEEFRTSYVSFFYLLHVGPDGTNSAHSS